MALTPEEKKRVLDALDQEDRSSLKRILASLKSFLSWLEFVLQLIYLIVKKSGFAEKLFNFVSNFF
jgi:hypothetical protein